MPADPPIAITTAERDALAQALKASAPVLSQIQARNLANAAIAWFSTNGKLRIDLSAHCKAAGGTLG